MILYHKRKLKKYIKRYLKKNRVMSKYDEKRVENKFKFIYRYQLFGEEIIIL